MAVIVILLIIELIATPIVLDIINDTKESSILRSSEFYLDGLEYLMSNRMLNDKTILDGEYDIMSNGNICLGVLENSSCTGEVLEVELDGQ